MDTISIELSFATTDAYSMLQFASSRGIVVPEKTTSDIVIARKNTKNMSKEQEVAFWLAYSELSKLIFPVTLEGIQAKADSYYKLKIGGKQLGFQLPSAAKRSVFGYTILTFTFLAFFLIVEIHNYLGTDSLNDLKEIESKLEFERSKPDSATKSINIENIEAKKKEVYKFLSSWNDISAAAIGSIYKTENEPAETKVDQLKKEKSTDVGQQLIAEKTIKSINIYLVPIICGILGVCSYILRSISDEIKNYTFTKESRIRFRLRVPLGCLAGAIAGLIFDSTKTQITSVLPPIGLAFALGYSVEIFFALIDSILSTVIKK